MADMLYRGWRIQAVNATQVGHKTNASARSRIGSGTSRKVRVYIVKSPDGVEKTLDKLSEAKSYIDHREGE